MNDERKIGQDFSRRVFENLTNTVKSNAAEIAMLRSQLQEAKRINQDAAAVAESLKVMEKFLATRGWKKDPQFSKLGIWENSIGKCNSFFGAIVEEIRFNGPAKTREQEIEEIGAIAKRLGLPESVQETLKAIAGDFQPESELPRQTHQRRKGECAQCGGSCQEQDLRCVVCEDSD